MHEAKLTVNEIEIQAQALALSIDQPGPLITGDHFEALTGLYGCEYTDQPLRDVVSLGNEPSFLFLSRFPDQGNVGTAGSLGHCSTVSFNPLRLLGYKGFEILYEKPAGGHEPLHGFRPTDGKVSLENEPIKTFYRSRDFLCILLDKLFHGVPSLVAVR